MVRYQKYHFWNRTIILCMPCIYPQHVLLQGCGVRVCVYAFETRKSRRTKGLSYNRGQCPAFELGPTARVLDPAANAYKEN
jgi:hypothetical protein